jgi:hypothetical protein
MLKEESLFSDGSFELLDSFWLEDSPHYVFTRGTNASSLIYDNRTGLVPVGYPAPCFYLHNNENSSLTMHFGSRFTLEGLNPAAIDNYLLEFDYWISHANHTQGLGPFTIDTRLYQVASTNLTNPTNYTNLQSTNFVYLTNTHKTFDLYSDNDSFVHFAYDGYSDLIRNNCDNNHTYLLDIQVNFPGRTTEINKQNQTLYIDNLFLTPYSITGAQGTDSGYGYQTNAVNITWSASFDSSQIARVCNYPFITLDDVQTTGYFHDGNDFEFRTTVYDPIEEKTIRLHFCWSNDELLMGNHYDGEYIIQGDVVDYYIKQEEVINPFGQEIILNLFQVLNDLVRNAKLVLAREYIQHQLAFGFR